MDEDDDSTPDPHRVGPAQTVILGPIQVDTATTVVLHLDREFSLVVNARRSDVVGVEFLAQPGVEL